jgi:hypothetical protein
VRPEVWLLLGRCHELGSGSQAQRQLQLGGVGAGPTLLPYRPAALGLSPQGLRTPTPLLCWPPTDQQPPPSPTPHLPTKLHLVPPPPPGASQAWSDQGLGQANSAARGLDKMQYETA